MKQRVRKHFISILFFGGIFVITGVFYFLNGALPNRGQGEGTIISFESKDIAAAVTLGERYRQYTDSQKRFSVEYPAGFTAKYFKEDDAETLVFQESNDAPDTPREEKNGFQIFIVPFEGTDGLTRERILEDIPGLVIEDIKEVVIGEGVHALLFWSEDVKLGRTREVWFTDNEGYLYEITTYDHFDSELAKILSTWKFYHQ